MEHNSRSGAPIDRGWAWLVMLGMFGNVALLTGITKSFGIFLDEFVAHFNIPVALGASVMGVSSLVYTIAAPLGVSAGQHFGQRGVVVLAGLVGGLGLSLSAPLGVSAGQHFGQRGVVVLAGLVGGLGLSLSGLLLSIEWVIVTFGAMMGFANGCVFGNGLVMVGLYFSKKRSLANGLALSGSGLGLFAIPPLLQLLLDTYSLRGTLIIVGAIYLNVSVFGLLFRPLSFYERPRNARAAPERHALISDEKDMHIMQASDIEQGVRNQQAAPDIDQAYPDMDQCVRNRQASSELQQSDTKSNEISPAHTCRLGCELAQKEEKEDIDVEHDDDICIEHVANDSLSHVSKYDRCAVVSNPKADPKSKRNFDNKVKSFLQRIVDIRVVRSYVVLMMLISGHLIYLGNFNFALFLPAAAFSKGINKYDKAWLVSINGMVDVIGRVSMGVIGDRNFLKKYKLMALSALLSGVAVLCFAFADTFWAMGVFVALYSLFNGGYLTILIPAMVDMFGIEVFPKVLTVLLFFQGLGVAIGQPALGAIRDATGSYLLVHIVSAVVVAVGAGVLCLYPFVEKLENRRHCSNKPTNDRRE